VRESEGRKPRRVSTITRKVSKATSLKPSSVDFSIAIYARQRRKELITPARMEKEK